jgi:hypothetical protein
MKTEDYSAKFQLREEPKAPLTKHIITFTVLAFLVLTLFKNE